MTRTMSNTSTAIATNTNNTTVPSKTTPKSKAYPQQAVIGCGMSVEVDPWESYLNEDEHMDVKVQAFVRLCNGQGWIPRIMNSQIYASTQTEPPDIRCGSFWFRVHTQSKRGIKVRRGPSRRAHPIELFLTQPNRARSQSSSFTSLTSTANEEEEEVGKRSGFRFECGEFLRASEVVTVFEGDEEHQNLNPSIGETIHAGGRSASSQCFAKLYRKSHLTASPTNSTTPPPPRTLAELTAHGEWVQVYGNGRLYLLESHDAPTIHRNREGWRYNAVSDVIVRRGPSVHAEQSQPPKVLRAGESVLINETVTAFDERVCWLRLKDGRGWVPDLMEDESVNATGQKEDGEKGRVVMIAHTLQQRKQSKKVSRNGNNHQHANHSNASNQKPSLLTKYTNNGIMDGVVASIISSSSITGTSTISRTDDNNQSFSRVSNNQNQSSLPLKQEETEKSFSVSSSASTYNVLIAKLFPGSSTHTSTYPRAAVTSCDVIKGSSNAKGGSIHDG